MDKHWTQAVKENPLMLFRIKFFLLFALAAGPLAAATVEVHQAVFPVQRQVAGETLELKGAGLAKFAGMLKICAAGLYAPPHREAMSVLDAPAPVKRLEIEYFVRVGRDRFARLALETLGRQRGAGELGPHANTIEAIHRLYRDVVPGDRYALSYHPDRGMWVELNGETLGRVEVEAAFAAMYFGIWLGENPISKSLRRSLLAGQGESR
jgi:hypothetical protein